MTGDNNVEDVTPNQSAVEEFAVKDESTDPSTDNIQPSSLIVDKSLEENEKELDDKERLELYKKGVEFRNHCADQHALLCFLGCLKGIKQSSSFPVMPECLRNIAEIYAKYDDFEKGIQFIQAAKLYYETAIVNSQLRENYEDSFTPLQGQNQEEVYKSLDEDADSDIAIRANEYEKLSHTCLKEKNIQLALEYCGKATQLRRKHYGDSHPVSVQSLDLFTMIYAEMGKQQYSDAFSKFSTTKMPVNNEPCSSDEQQQQEAVTENLESSTKVKGTKNKPKSVRFADLHENGMEEETGTSEDMLQDEPQNGNLNGVSLSVTDNGYYILSGCQFVIFLFFSVGLAILLTWGWCNVTANPKCPSYEYLKLKFKYYYYAYIQTWFMNETYL